MPSVNIYTHTHTQEDKNNRAREDRVVSEFPGLVQEGGRMQDAALEHSVGVTPRDGPRHCGSRTPAAAEEKRRADRQRPQCRRKTRMWDAPVNPVLPPGRCSAPVCRRQRRARAKKPATEPTTETLRGSRREIPLGTKLAPFLIPLSSTAPVAGSRAVSVSQSGPEATTKIRDRGMRPRTPMAPEHRSSTRSEQLIQERRIFPSPQGRIFIVKCRDKKSRSRPVHKKLTFFVYFFFFRRKQAQVLNRTEISP